MDNELYIPDCLFPTDNELEIPSLLMDVQPQYVEIPTYCFGEQARTTNMCGNGILHFYTDDYRFRTIYEHPEKILKYNPGSIIEPNFSLSNDTPIAFGLQAIYKKRFLARAMQEKGIGVFIDLNVAPKFYKLNLLGVPKGYQSFATRGCTDRLNELQFEYQIAQYTANGKPFRFVVYGGGNVIEQWCHENKAVYITPIIIIKNKLKAFEKMKDTIGFLDSEAKAKYEELKKTLYDTQVKDFGKYLENPQILLESKLK